jgi:hypothetical protein
VKNRFAQKLRSRAVGHDLMHGLDRITWCLAIDGTALTTYTALVVGKDRLSRNVGRSDDIPLREVIIPLGIHHPHDPDLHSELVDLELGLYTRTSIETETAYCRALEGVERHAQDDWQGCQRVDL